MNFSLTILGSNAAVPAHNRYPTAQFLQLDDKKFLIDCGEGTQFQLTKYKLKRSGLNHIFISHLHGDHFLGLAGLISTFRLNGKRDDLHIYGPPHLETILSVQLDIIDKEWTFDIIFHPLKFGVSEKIYDDERLEVFTIPLNHSIDCNGFLFKAKGGPRKIIGDKIKEHQIPYQAIHAIKYGADFTNAQGDIIKNEELTLAPCAPKSYAYCSDTKYDESIIPFILNVDLLYHEATFMQDLQTVAQERFHSTTIEAAQIAQIAQVKKLIIGHFSARYADLNPMLTEAKTTFLHTELALEGHHFEI